MGRGSSDSQVTSTSRERGQLKLWLDDLRLKPDESWTWVKTIDEAKEVLLNNVVAIASLDNDLGENIPEGRKLVLWMAETETWPQAITIHSANPVAVEYMAGMIERYSPLKRQGRSLSFVSA